MTAISMSEVFKHNNIRQQRLIEALHEDGVLVSRNLICNFLKHGDWPKRIDPVAIKNAVKRILRGVLPNKEINAMLANAPKEGRDCKQPIYGVIPLLHKYNISQAAMQRALKNDYDISLSASSFTQILRHGHWPRTVDRAAIESAINQFLTAYATEKELDGIWTESRKVMTNQQVQIEAKPKQVTIFEQPEPQMLNQQTMNHFGLTRHPFENEIRSEDDLFMSDKQMLLREAMLQAALGGSMLAVIGECGAGKTEIRKGFIEYVRRNHPEIQIIEPMVINKKRLTPEMIFEALAEDLNIKTMPQGLERRARVVERALKRSVKTGNRHVLVIEEAHDLTDNVIKQLKRIWELSDGFTRLISVILIGQPELEAQLSPSNYEVREFARRCNIMKVTPLGSSITEYIAHKFQRCNVNYLNVIDNDAITTLRSRLQAKVSYGVSGRAADHQDMSFPLIVNNWLVIAMNLAAELGEHKVSSEVIEEIK